MNAKNMFTKSGTKMFLALGLAAGLIVLLGAGLSMAAQSLPADGVTMAADNPGQPGSLPLDAGPVVVNLTGSAEIEGDFDFEYTWNLAAGLWEVTIKRDYAPFTATISLTPTQAGMVTATGAISVFGDIPTVVSGGTPNNLTVPVTGTATFTATGTASTAGPMTLTANGYAPVKGKFVLTSLGGNVNVKSNGTFEGSGPAKGTLTAGDYSLFLPLVYSPTYQYINFYDNFNNCKNWATSTSDICTVECTGGYMRVTAKQKNEECVIPGFGVPAVLDGLFSVEMRRTTPTERHLMYTMFFGQTGADLYENSYRAEVWPDREEGEKNVYFGAFDDGSNRNIKEAEAEDLHSGEDKWNDLEVLRDGTDVMIYVNDDKVIDKDDDYHRDGPGYFALRVVSFSDEDVVVEFDDFRIVNGTKK